MSTSKKLFVKLYQYQMDWLQDVSRFKIGMFARQTGKTFICTLEIVESCITAEAEGRRSEWLIVSASERQSLNAMRYVKKHLKALNHYWQTKGNSYLEGRSENKHEVVLPVGSRIISVAANPNTIRGYSCNVYADEFAFHEDSEALWAALHPIVSNGFRLLITSTPNGKGNRFYRLFTEEGNSWSKHKVDIYEAIDQGLPRNAETLKRSLADIDIWAQEYELQWLDEATAWLPYSLIAQCEADFLGVYSPKNPCYVGVDIGRRHDLFVIWVLEKQGDIFYQRKLIAEKGISFSQQEAFLVEVMDYYKPVRVCIDQSGMGEQFTERAKDQYGSYIVEGVIFSGPMKLDLANNLRRNFEDQSVKIWAGDKLLRNDLHALKRSTTAAGNVRFVAERNESGHADRAWALALALHAGHSEHQEFEYESIEKNEWASDVPWDE